MSRTRLALAVLLTLPAAATACLWDHDTLAQERSRFPTALELITGKFLRHSPEFYEWRVRDRRKKLQADPTNLLLHDDLVVALDKLGRHDEALAVVEAANKLQSNRYETESNWGTVLIHAGRLEEGLAHLDAAVRINPDAHFGREVVQRQVVRWVLDARKAGRTLPVTAVREPDADGRAFWSLLADWPAQEEKAGNHAAAVKGVLGMMRFGRHDSPVLLEALGRLLSDEDDAPTDAKRLSARAFLRASDVAPDPAVKKLYRAMAKRVLMMQGGTEAEAETPLTLERLEQDFRRELADADAWYADLRAKEIAWVNDPAVDPDAEFARLYAADPEVVGDGSRVPSPAQLWWREKGPAVFAGVCVLVVLLTLFVAVGLVVRLVLHRAKILAQPPAA